MPIQPEPTIWYSPRYNELVLFHWYGLVETHDDVTLTSVSVLNKLGYVLMGVL